MLDRFTWLMVLFCVSGMILVFAPLVPAEDSAKERGSSPLPRVYIDLDRDFYEALKERSDGRAGKVYSSDPDHEYLRRIAVSSEFAVKTNLEILRRQEEIIRLLESLKDLQMQDKGR